MSITEDLINFDIIESQKENIQSLPGGRSAKALASTFAPTSRSSGPTPGDTRNLNDAIRQEYELEVVAIAESDDPLDVYDRYVKWTLGAYPSAQATPESQLRPLLERATKAFQSTSHYKNDPRYLKLWLNYIRFFSDSPRETFAYLARHNIGDELALFYEEFAAWLEGAGRWTQADEVYMLGIEREARPTERLARKYSQFQQRFEHRVRNGDEPSSPALPTVRPALAAKIDPFAISTPRSTDPQAQRPAGIGGSSTLRGGKQKLAIFSDADTPASTMRPNLGEVRGWDNIGSIEDRKKENTIEAKPWAGETLKGAKRANGPPRLMIFKDESHLQLSNLNRSQVSRHAEQQQVTNAKTGKIERVFVDLDAVYPNADNPDEEMSFEELRAQSRGWLNRDWGAERRAARQAASVLTSLPEPISSPASAIEDMGGNTQESQPTIEAALRTDSRVEAMSCKDTGREGKPARPKKIKVMEVKGETQTIKTNLASPTGPKLRRKPSAEPTMTLHTKAATEDILDIFNQPLRNMGPLGSQVDSNCESDYDDEDYTSAGESTGTGRISGTSEYGDDDADSRSLADRDEINGATDSPWSDFTKSKHVPKVDTILTSGGHEHSETNGEGFIVLKDVPKEDQQEADEELVTPVMAEPEIERHRTKFIPLPPEDSEAPTHPYRDPSQAFQNRLPFMTPIVEKTESSMGALTIREEKDYFNSKTPSRQHGDGSVGLHIEDELLSSPFQEIINEARLSRHDTKNVSPVKASKKVDASQKKVLSKVPKSTTGTIIRDGQCNPVDDSIRNTILENLEPPLSASDGFHDLRPETFNRGLEIRKFVKALTKVSKNGSDKTTSNLSVPPTLTFSNSTTEVFTIRRELGKGAFAPVYLAEQTSSSADEAGETASKQVAIKCEHPPTPWEFYIMNTLQTRLAHSRAASSLLQPHSLHLFADEGYLIEQYLDQGTLLDLVNTAKADPSGVLDECAAMFFTIELLRTVEAMHSVGILHGDLKADNCLVRLSPVPTTEEWDNQYHADGSHGWSVKGLSLIDFGRGIDMRHFRPEVQFVADWKTSKADCVEMRELRPWTWQVDYWGMAGVIHSLLFGKYIEDVVVPEAKNESGEAGGGLLGKGGRRYKLRESLKRYWQTEIWGGVFELLLNPTLHVEGEEAGRMPVMKGLRRERERMEEWLEREAGRRGLRSCLRRLEERIREGRRK